MRYETEFVVHDKPQRVFASLHRYKEDRDANKYFLGKDLSHFIDMGFTVTSPLATGLGATYDWNFTLMGIPVLKFQERIVLWEEGKKVGYQGVKGWNFYFETELTPTNGDTTVHTLIDFSTGVKIIDRLAKPFFELGLQKVSKSVIEKSLPSNI